jgi:Bacterial antitoxin of ParD toxin-antitoxin type II system and RHH
VFASDQKRRLKLTHNQQFLLFAPYHYLVYTGTLFQSQKCHTTHPFHPATILQILSTRKLTAVDMAPQAMLRAPVCVCLRNTKEKFKHLQDALIAGERSGHLQRFDGKKLLKKMRATGIKRT